MPALRAAWRLLRAVLHVLHGLMLMPRFATMDTERRHDFIRWWSAGFVRALGVSMQLSGVAPRAGATLVVANHVSWLDIALLHTALPQARFVSKADVGRWPLLGRVIRLAGTLFIERERKRDAVRVVHDMAQALRAGDTVAVFPEGTTGPGPVPLAFHANLLQAAVVTGTPVQPVALRYADARRPFSAAVQYEGQTTLARSLWRVLSARGLRAHVRLLPPVGSVHADRRALAAHLRELIAQQLQP